MMPRRWWSWQAFFIPCLRGDFLMTLRPQSTAKLKKPQNWHRWQHWVWELVMQSKPAQPILSLKGSGKAWSTCSRKSPPQGNRGERRLKAAAPWRQRLKLYLSVPPVKWVKCMHCVQIQWWYWHAEDYLIFLLWLRSFSAFLKEVY